jgi:hypothetical protein
MPLSDAPFGARRVNFFAPRALNFSLAIDFPEQFPAVFTSDFFHISPTFYSPSVSPSQQLRAGFLFLPPFFFFFATAAPP